MRYEKSGAEWDKIEAQLKESANLDNLNEDRSAIVRFQTERKQATLAWEKYREMEWKLPETIQQIAKNTSTFPAIRIKVMQRLIALYRAIPTILEKDFGMSSEQFQAILQAYEEDNKAKEEQYNRDADLATMPYEHYLQTPEWDIKRSEALRRANNRCELCNATRYLQVHHKTYERRGHERPDDLIVLCRDCHARHHDKVVHP